MKQSILRKFTELPNHERCLAEYKALYDRARTPQFSAEDNGLQVGAYSLIPYLAESGAFEFVWNAQDDVPLGCLELAATGEHACAVRAPLYFPEYVPSVGERVLVKMTPIRAKVNSLEHINKLKLKAATGDSDAQMRVMVFEELVRREGSEDAAIERLAGKEMEVPDLLVVTHGWLEELQRARDEGTFFRFITRDEAIALIDRLHAEGRMNDESHRQMRGSVEAKSTQWIAFQPVVIHTGRRKPGSITMGAMFESADGEAKHVSEMVHETVLNHAMQHELTYKDGAAATYPPSTPGARVLGSTTLFNGALCFVTMIDQRGAIGSTFVVAANAPWPKWQMGIRHESQSEALDYFTEMVQLVCKAFNTEPSETIDVYDFSHERRKVGKA